MSSRWFTGVNLRPRAVAILVALRGGPRNDAELQHAIADAALSETQDMTRCLGSDLACRTVGMPGPLIAKEDNSVQWHLTDYGCEWLGLADHPRRP